MEHHKDMYKGNCRFLSPQRLKTYNRETLQISRAKKRNDLFFNSRNISLSPINVTGERISATSTPAPNSKIRTSLLIQTPIKLDGNAEFYENKENFVDGIVETGSDEAAIKKNEKIPRVTGESGVGNDLANINKKAVEKHISRMSLGIKKDEKLSRQEMYLKKYVEWKQKKKFEEMKKAKSKHLNLKGNFKKMNDPLNTANEGDGNVQLSVAKSFKELIPKNHQFKPPEGLKDPTKDQPVIFAQSKLRRSIYTVVSTPPKKKLSCNLEKKNPIISCKPTKMRTLSKEKQIFPPSNTQVNRRAVSKDRVEVKIPACISAGNPVGPSLRSNDKRLNTQTKAVVSNVLNKNPANNRPLRSNQGKPASGPSARADLADTNASTKPILPTTIAPTKSNIVPQKQISSTKWLSKGNQPKKAYKTSLKSGVGSSQSGGCDGNGGSGGGAIAKAQKLLQRKEDLALSLETKEKPNKLSTRMKAKNNIPKIKINLNDKRQLIETQVADILPLQTPTIINSDNPFEPLATSTAQKSISQKIARKPQNRKQHEAPEKIETKAKQVKSLSLKAKNTKKESISLSQNVKEDRQPLIKYNFMENFDTSCGDFLGGEKNKEEPPPSIAESSANKVEKETFVEINHTPKSLAVANTPDHQERPSNYVSPYVTVSRGKVSLKAEKEKRNSVYLQSNSPQTPITEDSKQTNSENPMHQTPIEVKRALEAVHYFRQQLADEIDRLLSLCDKWQAYKDENLEMLQENGGDDMIHVTIGQTKLLTSKKLMQFKGLIDRCEAGATGVNCLPDDGSEDTKPITPIDLEGFWSMVNLQIENVNNRFENLEKWKSNDWIDPQEIKPTKTKKKFTKVTKKTKTTNAKVKPSNGLRQFLQKLQKEQKGKKIANMDENGIDIICNNGQASANFTPRRSRRSSRLFVEDKETPTNTRRVSIIVKDRKSFSNSPTIITIHSPLRRRSSIITRKSLKNSSPLVSLNTLNKLEKNPKKDNATNDLLKAALLGATEEVSLFKSSISNTNVDTDCTKTKMEQASSPPRLVSRKSILKTPGTAKDKSKNVIFNNKLEIRKFNFLINDPTSDEEEDDNNDWHKNSLKSETGLEACAKSEEDSTQEKDGLSEGTPRVYRLRHRKVYLRPSCEIVIPQ